MQTLWQISNVLEQNAEDHNKQQTHDNLEIKLPETKPNTEDADLLEKT